MHHVAESELGKRPGEVVGEGATLARVKTSPPRTVTDMEWNWSELLRQSVFPMAEPKK